MVHHSGNMINYLEWTCFSRYPYARLVAVQLNTRKIRGMYLLPLNVKITMKVKRNKQQRKY